jgi:hypothetical protein
MTISRMQEPRQLYGLGSLVKKITKPIKKVVKSPIGKAALAGAAIYFGGGGGNPFTAAGRSGFGSNAFGELIKRGLLGAKTAAGERGITREGGLLGLLKSGFSGAASGFGNLSTGQKAFLLGGAGLSLLPFLTGGAEEEETVVEEGFDVTPGTITNIVAQARGRDPSLRFLPQRQFAQPGFFTAAEGGTPRAELFAGGLPMLLRGMDQESLMKLLKGASNVTPGGRLLNLLMGRRGETVPTMEAAEGGVAELPQVRMLEGGVPEIDYRQSGGFVPMGKKEKADDVPAMLSKNEFVMTADAVRGMGDGNVEKGAQKMYDQMRELESRVV